MFFLGIISISNEHEILSLFVFISFITLLFINKEKRFVVSLLLLFLVGFNLFVILNNFVGTLNISSELRVILNRFFLVFIILGLLINHIIFNKKIFWYNNKPNWKNPIVLPFHKVDMFLFWIIGIVVNVIVYLFFIVPNDTDYTYSFVMFGLSFSLINAVFEEVIWRGLMLSSFEKYTTSVYSLLVTSIGFGLFHLVIGFPFFVCLLVSVAGLVYGLITIKTNSIYPSIVFHIIINIGMVFSGFIL